MPMTTHQLAIKLLACKDVPVLIDAYEGGLTTIKEIIKTEIVETVGHPLSCWGEYDSAERPTYDPAPNKAPFAAVVLSRHEPG